MHEQYLILVAEITRNKKATIVAQGHEISIESPKNGVWVIKTVLSQFEEKIPSKIAECLFSCGLMAFQNAGPTLHAEDKKIILTKAHKEPSGYIEFKNLIKNFIFVADEWRETLRELSRKSPSKLSKESLLFAY